jgi:hypothetical protein
MAKKGLKRYLGQSIVVTGDVEEISMVVPMYGEKIPSILIKHIFLEGDTSQQLTDHIWIIPNSMAQFIPFPEVSVADKVRFKAYVTSYQRKNHQASHFDNTLSNICEFEIVSSGSPTGIGFESQNIEITECGD